MHCVGIDIRLDHGFGGVGGVGGEGGSKTSDWIMDSLVLHPQPMGRPGMSRTLEFVNISYAQSEEAAITISSQLTQVFV